MSKDLYAAIKDRRSIYGISKASPISQERIQEIISEGVKHAPTAFNSQGARVIVLFGDHHNKLWNLTTQELKKVTPPEMFGDTLIKMNAFGAGYGTVLFFEDIAVTTALQQQFPLYKDNFPIFAQHSNGMLQFIIWTSLESEGLGASLQHYSPLIDDAVRSEWKVPPSWQLIAQMPFGTPVSPPGEKNFEPLEERVKFFN